MITCARSVVTLPCVSDLGRFHTLPDLVRWLVLGVGCRVSGFCRVKSMLWTLSVMKREHPCCYCVDEILDDMRVRMGGLGVLVSRSFEVRGGGFDVGFGRVKVGHFYFVTT